MNIIGGYQDTRTNQEDFALTPFLFGVLIVSDLIKVYGIGVCWGWHSIYIGVGFGIPKDCPKFQVVKKKY